MKNIRFFCLKIFLFWLKFSIYLNRRVFIMKNHPVEVYKSGHFHHSIGKRRRLLGTLRQIHDVALTFMRCCINVMCPLGMVAKCNILNS